MPAKQHPEAVVDGVVLAAGRSRRMGRPKPLLGADDRSFMERVVKTLREAGCRQVVAVIRPGADAVGTAASEAGARVLVNPDEKAEQIDSLRLALRSLDPGADAALLLPVDHPLVRPATARALIDAFAERGAAIVRALHDGRPGHPTLFAADTFDALFETDLPRGAESVVEARSADRLDVEVDDPGVLADIDTPEDYRRHVEDA